MVALPRHGTGCQGFAETLWQTCAAVAACSVGSDQWQKSLGWGFYLTGGCYKWDHDFLNNQILVYVYFQTCWCCVWCWVWAWGAVMIDVRMVGRWFSLKSALKPRNLMQFGPWTVEGSTYRQSERKTRLCSINGVTPHVGNKQHQTAYHSHTAKREAFGRPTASSKGLSSCCGLCPWTSSWRKLGGWPMEFQWYADDKWHLCVHRHLDLYTVCFSNMYATVCMIDV